MKIRFVGSPGIEPGERDTFATGRRRLPTQKQREQWKNPLQTLMKNLHLPVFVAGGIHCQVGNLRTFPVFCTSGILYRASTVAGGVCSLNPPSSITK